MEDCYWRNTAYLFEAVRRRCTTWDNRRCRRSRNPPYGKLKCLRAEEFSRQSRGMPLLKTTTEFAKR